MNEKFFSKVLLFGEYSIIRDSMALAMPYKVYQGHLSFNKKIDPELMGLYEYLKNKANLSLDFDLENFYSEINSGLYFDSTIPRGYGIGSSGTLCAALFSRYSNSKRNEIISVKKFFSEMESYFHGSSSGLDPLISFLNTPILVKDRQINLTSLPEFTHGQGGIFLLNTGCERRTEPLVNLFLEKCKAQDFSTLCDTVLNPITDACITSFLKADILSLYEFFREISDFQFRHFSPMVPKNFQPLWRDGLKSEEFYLKLCGAGGGGFLMGITRDIEKAKSNLRSYAIEPVFTF